VPVFWQVVFVGKVSHDGCRFREAKVAICQERHLTTAAAAAAVKHWSSCEARFTRAVWWGTATSARERVRRCHGQTSRCSMMTCNECRLGAAAVGGAAVVKGNQAQCALPCKHQCTCSSIRSMHRLLLMLLSSLLNLSCKSRITCCIGFSCNWITRLLQLLTTIPQLA
jgi:hypothetical protein